MASGLGRDVSHQPSPLTTTPQTTPIPSHHHHHTANHPTPRKARPPNNHKTPSTTPQTLHPRLSRASRRVAKPGAICNATLSSHLFCALPLSHPPLLFLRSKFAPCGLRTRLLPLPFP